MRCSGLCGKVLNPDDPVVEVERNDVFCMSCAIITTAGTLQEVYEQDEKQLSLI